MDHFGVSGFEHHYPSPHQKQKTQEWVISGFMQSEINFKPS